MKKALIILLVLMLMLAMVPTVALAAGTTYRVWDSAQLATALGSADTGDTIFLYEGDYSLAPKTIISKAISIVGESESGVIIKPTGNTTASSGVNDNRGWLVVNAGITLNLSKVTLDGAGYTINQGIRSNGTLIANNVTMKNINGGGSYGQGIILIGSGSVLKNITMSEINRVGIGIYNSTTVNGFYYTGKGVVTTALDYGIEVGTIDASTAAFTVNISNVTITGSRGTVGEWGSSGIAVTTYFYAAGGGTDPNLITVNIDHATISNCSSGVNAGYPGFFECSNINITDSNFFDNEYDLVYYGRTPGSGTFNASGNYYGGSAPIAWAASGLTITGIETYSTTPISMNQNTDVTAGVEPTYIIVIPAAVDFGTLVKDSGTVGMDFDVTAQGVVIEKNAHIDVDVTGPFEMKNNNGSGTVSLAYGLRNESGAITPPGQFASFTGDGTEDGTVAVNTANITTAGSYKGTMVFSITYEN
jgi:hypothetical protein